MPTDPGASPSMGGGTTLGCVSPSQSIMKPFMPRLSSGSMGSGCSARSAARQGVDGTANE